VGWPRRDHRHLRRTAPLSERSGAPSEPSIGRKRRPPSRAIVGEIDATDHPRSEDRPLIILDCDPGHDDAIAIVVAAHLGELIGITTVAGNAPLDRTTHNALVMRELLGLDVPVHSGAARPLLAEAVAAADVHGVSGLDGADLPAPQRELDSDDAVSFLVESCRNTEGAWIVAVGPLTNVAMALRRAPDLAGRVAGISVMGGGTFGNRSPVGEFNVWADPEAAAIVFGYGGPLLMAGLDVTHQFLATAERITRITAVGGRLATTFGGLLTFFSSSYRSRHDDIAGAPMHDPLAVLAVTRPDLFESRRRHVAVETAGNLTRGMTVIDERTLRSRPPANCGVLTSVDDETAFACVLAAIAAFSKA
jgi:inosine-uridine nucleoside N-ribohydrolase